MLNRYESPEARVNCHGTAVTVVCTSEFPLNSIERPEGDTSCPRTSSGVIRKFTGGIPTLLFVIVRVMTSVKVLPVLTTIIN